MTEKYKVTRQVLFDRLYQTGEIYEGNASEVAHLVGNGVLVRVKAETASKNKAEPKAENKAEG